MTQISHDQKEIKLGEVSLRIQHVNDMGRIEKRRLHELGNTRGSVRKRKEAARNMS